MDVVLSDFVRHLVEHIEAIQSWPPTDERHGAVKVTGMVNRQSARQQARTSKKRASINATILPHDSFFLNPS